jgi:hypothetical protein
LLAIEGRAHKLSASTEAVVDKKVALAYVAWNEVERE